ncbi:hypothetical protein TTHERM_000894429 (macronuclear) [Tetrahymena thermophila SB210]|uniref:Uncharacterized protein n=1 Tax=Tetrahymena thermophila (strain SB210) TaxID=312017 RepID=W7XAE9_TETTS|nr:hypothetical protein TTHERM_000894429 [Tetrahymena thermophila SB210]EWS73368.1 hypothetical protein TTHERM_000894429 [Tetrahymena thermophila SB210]|eukprot:XP_012654101.1 hypothetical protein TTHERM_000894429 [Tetrahymena thermophila SB210]
MKQNFIEMLTYNRIEAIKEIIAYTKLKFNCNIIDQTAIVEPPRQQQQQSSLGILKYFDAITSPLKQMQLAIVRELIQKLQYQEQRERINMYKKQHTIAKMQINKSAQIFQIADIIKLGNSTIKIQPLIKNRASFRK